MFVFFVIFTSFSFYLCAIFPFKENAFLNLLEWDFCLFLLLLGCWSCLIEEVLLVEAQTIKVIGLLIAVKSFFPCFFPEETNKNQF